MATQALAIQTTRWHEGAASPQSESSRHSQLPTQIPLEHASSWEQASPSSQGAPPSEAVWTQPASAEQAS